MQPPVRTVTVGQVFTVGVAITDVVDLGAFKFTPGNTSTVVEAATVIMDSFLGSTGWAFAVAGTIISPTAGKVAFGAYSPGATPEGPSGNGVLAVLTLRALAEREHPGLPLRPDERPGRQPTDVRWPERRPGGGGPGAEIGSAIGGSQ